MRDLRDIGSGLAVIGRCLAIIALIALAFSPLATHQPGFDDHGAVEIAVGPGAADLAPAGDEPDADGVCHPASVCSLMILVEPTAAPEIFVLASAPADMTSPLLSGLATPPVTKPPIF